MASVIVKYRTVSIWMPTLSPVMTPAGLNVTTCSRRSMSGRDAVDERHDDRQPRRQRALVAPEALHDARARLRDDPDGLRGEEQHEQRDDDEDDEAGFHAAPS